MALAIFGISNDGLNLVVNLFVLMLVVRLAGADRLHLPRRRRRISDPFLVACATVASFFPYIGTAVYAIVRPPEFLEDAHERELEIKAAELRVRQLTELSCPNCEYPVEKNFLRCPNCQRRLKDPCPTCGKPVDPRWALCPYCETALGAASERRAAPGRGRKRADRRGAPGPRARSAAPKDAQPPKKQPPRREARSARPSRQRARRRPRASRHAAPARGARRPRGGHASRNSAEQRSPSREPDPDPRQA